DPTGVRLVELALHGAVRQDALGHLADQPAGDQRRGLLDLEVVDLVALLASDDEHVPEAARGDEADALRLALDDDVGAERGSVDRQSPVARLAAALPQQPAEPPQ